MKTRRIIGDILIYVILAVMAVVWILPIVWLVLQAFGNSGGIVDQNRFIPSSFGFENFIGLFTNEVWWGASKGGFRPDTNKFTFFFRVENGQLVLGSFMNTLVVSFCTMIFATLLTLMTSYSLSRLRFRGRHLIMRVCLVMGMFPGFLSLIILYWVFRLLNDVLGTSISIFTLVFVYSAGAGAGYYISKGFFDTISRQVDEAAMIDGASRFQIFYKIILPLSKPIIVYTAMTSFMGPWGEYVTSSFLAGTNTSMYTVSVQLYKMITTQEYSSIYWGWFCAAAVIIAIPISLLFIFMQRYYVSGVTGGAVKG